MSKKQAIRLYKKLYWLRLELNREDENTLNEVLDELQAVFCSRGCRNGDLTDGGLFTPINWCDCPLGQESSEARITVV